MPTIITHSFVGLIAAKSMPNNRGPRGFLFFSMLCPVIPDFDIIAFEFGIPYEHFFGHRGFSHSLVFAAIIAAVVTFIFFKEKKYFLYFFFITATHGLLDAITTGGKGIALLAPFNNHRYFFPWAVIKVSHIGIGRFFTLAGLQAFSTELLWLWLPLLLFLLCIKNISSLNK